jgi:hypothetical protein
VEAARRYIESYELISGSEFRITDEPILDRIERSLASLRNA